MEINRLFCFSLDILLSPQRKILSKQRSLRITFFLSILNLNNSGMSEEIPVFYLTQDF